MAEAERIKALGEAARARGARPGEPADDQQLAGGDGQRQPALPAPARRRRDGPGLDDVRPGGRPARRRPAARDDAGARRRGLHGRARHQLRADLRPLPAGRRAGRASPPRSTPWSGPKQTALGEGYFVTTRNTWYVGDRAGRDDAVPGAQVQAPGPGGLDRRARAGRGVRAAAADEPRHRRSSGRAPPPASCGSSAATPAARCGIPPGPVCPACRALDRGYVVASGRGTVFSYVVHRHPPVPGRGCRSCSALVELEEGVRMVGELRGRRGRRDRDRDAGDRATSTGSTTT